MFMQEEVQAGMQLLDEHKSEWEEAIDLDILNIASPFRCTLGQAYGSFSEGLAKLGIAGSGKEYGFCLPSRPPAFAGPTRIQFEMLTATWKHEIAVRREQAAEQERELVLV